MASAEKLPVVLVTGYLGSGKTTLISRLLAHPELGESAVIVNELGEVGIDHHLLRQVDERTVLLKNGCVCCSLRGDLADELRELLSRRERGEIPRFRRVVVETTGIADPGPVVYTLVAEPVVRHHYRLESVVATVDAVHGLRGPESVKQVTAADTVVVTKPDLAEPGELAARLERLNPVADVVAAAYGDVAPERLLAGSSRERVLEAVEAAHDDDAIAALSFAFDEPLDWTAFGIWLTMLLQARGADILRVKGLLDVGGPGPVLLNAVQHVVHPPEHLDAWPDGDRRSRLVFIGRNLDAGALETSLAAFNRAARH